MSERAERMKTALRAAEVHGQPLPPNPELDALAAVVAAEIDDLEARVGSVAERAETVAAWTEGAGVPPAEDDEADGKARRGRKGK